jgi:hypothetical protein
MRDKKTATRDALPEDFTSLGEFWEFWDTHSSADYEDTMEAVAFEIDPFSSKSTSEESLTDRKRLDALQDEDIDLTDAPEITREMFAKAVVRRGLPPPLSKLPHKNDPS